MRFEPTIWIKEGEFSLIEIDSVQAAQEFLERHPLRDRGPLFYVLSNMLIAACDGGVGPSEARLAFSQYAEDIGILAHSQRTRVDS